MPSGLAKLRDSFFPLPLSARYLGRWLHFASKLSGPVEAGYDELHLSLPTTVANTSLPTQQKEEASDWLVLTYPLTMIGGPPGAPLKDPKQKLKSLSEQNCGLVDPISSRGHHCYPNFLRS